MIGKTLQKILIEKRVTVGELARRTGISDQTLYSIIRRNNLKVSFEALLKICAALDINVECFYAQYSTEDSPAVSDPRYLTPRQIAVIKAYSRHPELQQVVDRVLGILPDTSDFK